MTELRVGADFAAPMIQTFELIAARRRSIYAYLPRPVPRELITWAIGVACLAPNHYRTRPWRFIVFTDSGRDKLADAYERAAIRLGRDVDKARDRAHAAPVMIAVACVPQIANPKVKPQEEHLATAAAIQNLMLALAAAEIGSIWTTGDLVESEEVRSTAGLAPGNRIMGVIYAGFRDPGRPVPLRAVIETSDVTTWCTS
jgi:nitroreductase